MKIISKGIEISKTRIRAGYSMRELGRLADVNMSVISQMEAHNKSVTPKTAKRICEVLGKEFDDLFTMRGNEETA